MRVLSKWMLALLEAWVCGDAPWLFRDGQSVAVLAWLDGGNERVLALAQEHGITPKTHPPKAPNAHGNKTRWPEKDGVML